MKQCYKVMNLQRSLLHPWVPRESWESSWHVSDDVWSQHKPNLWHLHPWPTLLPHHSFTIGIPSHKVSFFKLNISWWRLKSRIKRRPIQPLDQSRNFDLLYVTETKHKKLNRKEYRYEWFLIVQDCIKPLLGAMKSIIITLELVWRKVWLTG